MIGKNINSSKPVTLAQAKEILEVRAKDGELQFEQAGSLAYCTKFSKVSAKEAEKLVGHIAAGKVTEELAGKMVDIMPKHKSQIALILSKDKVEISDDEAEKILKLLAPHAEKKAEEAAVEPAGQEAKEEKEAKETKKEKAEKPEKAEKGEKAEKKTKEKKEE